MNKKLTKPMQQALDKMKPGKKYCAYELGVSLNTLFALHDRGLVMYSVGLGSVWYPRVNLDWWLKEEKEQNNK